MKIYTLTIVYDDKMEEIEYISEEIEGDSQSTLEEYGVIETGESFDDEDLMLITGCHIIGKA